MRLTCLWLQKRSLLILFLSVLLFPALPGFSQAKRVFRGVVTDEKNTPLEGVSVVVKGSPNGVSTKNDGSFSIEAAEGARLVFTSVGAQSKEVTARGSAPLQVQLSSTASTLNDVVVIGYGTQRKKDLTGAIATVNIAEAKKVSTSDINGLLQGRAAGVQVNLDGQPGASPSVRIRGFSTFGSAAPFYVVDGVPVGTSIRDFSPNDVESISVLKDAAAASIYGASAANGVIIITTRQGRKNAPLKVEYNAYYGWDNVWQKKSVTGTADYQILNNESRVNAGQLPFPANNPINRGNAATPYISPDSINTDWQKAGLKQGSRQNHNISMFGGGASNTYNISLDYFDNTGTYVGNGPDYKRYSARVNSSAEKGIVRVGETFNYTHSRENTLTFRDDILLGGIPPLIGSLVTAIPTMPVYDPALLNGFGGSNSDYQGANSLNGIAINSILTNYVDVDRTFGNVYGELQLIKNSQHNLRFRSSASYDKTVTRDYTWQPAFYLGKFFSKNVAQLGDNSRVLTNASIENTLNYDLTIGKHSIQALAGQSYRQNDYLLRTATGIGYTTPYVPTISNATTTSATSYQSTTALSSYFGRINYAYGDRYLLSATLRRDGSSRFAPQYRYGYFPAAAVGWKVSNESFWNVPKSAVSQIKLRASYGKLGNDLNLGPYAYQGVVNSGVVYIFNGVRTTGALQTIISSPAVKWEAKAISNVGFDATFLNNHFDFSAEYYYTKSTDILIGVTIPLSTGYINSNPTVNAASLANKGYEFSGTYHKTGGKFTFDISANLSTVSNEVLAIGTGNAYLSGVGSRTVVGREVGEQFGYVYSGLFQSQAEINASATQFGLTLKPGDVKYKDISGPNGKPDGKIDENDRTFLGSGIPKYNYGFNFSASYEHFDFSLFLQGSAKFLINSRLYRDLHHSGGAQNYSTDMLNRWTPTNTNTDIPRLSDKDANNGLDSDRPGWLQDGTYLRISNVNLGYTLPANTIKGLSKARLYVSAQNLYTFQKYYGYNPDFTSGVLNPGFDFGSYPRPRTIMVGLQVGF